MRLPDLCPTRALRGELRSVPAELLSVPRVSPVLCMLRVRLVGYKFPLAGRAYAQMCSLSATAWFHHVCVCVCVCFLNERASCMLVCWFACVCTRTCIHVCAGTSTSAPAYPLCCLFWMCACVHACVHWCVRDFCVLACMLWLGAAVSEVGDGRLGGHRGMIERWLSNVQLTCNRVTTLASPNRLHTRFSPSLVLALALPLTFTLKPYLTCTWLG